MSAAVDICLLDHCIQKELFEKFRSMIHEAADQLVDALAKDLLSGKPMTLAEITRVIRGEIPRFSAAVLQEFIQGKHGELLSQDYAECPQCGKKVHVQSEVPRTVETLLGATTLSRPYFYCKKCRYGFYPTDLALGLSPRRKQDDLQELALEFLADLSFERASDLFCKSTGISFSDHQMHQLFAEFIADTPMDDIIPSADEIKRRIADVAEGKKRRPVLVVATDGAHTPTRPHGGGRTEKWGPGEYREAKGFRFYLLDDDRIVHLISWHQVCNAEELGQAIRKAASRIPVEKVRPCLLGDGASWLWKAMKTAFPKAREVLDYYHCAEHIHALADAQYGHDPQKRFLWVESTMARLSRKDGVGSVIGGIKRMKPVNKKAEELQGKLVTYLKANRNRSNYNGARRGGYAIGSGGIESANKFVCHVRIKRSGAWWLVSNCNKMLKLRCALVNGTFEQLFTNYALQEKAKRLSRNS